MITVAKKEPIVLSTNQINEERVEKFLEKYQHLVWKYARRYSLHSQMNEDLTQVGMIGLLLAINRYSEDRGSSFEAFAIPTIIGEIKRYLRDQTWSVHVPRRVKEMGPRIHKKVEELTIKLQRTPTVKEVAGALEISVKEVEDCQQTWQSYQAISLYKQFNREDEELTLLDIIPVYESELDNMIHSQYIKEMMKHLTENEKKIIFLTVMDGFSQKQAAEKLGLSQMQVSRLKRKALENLKYFAG
ncbi:SigB/SigF/SigG family RNA polymerase sigma factor [Halalkalibacter nanhaiisediminis]|uniref:RNA polymerase sigma-B factor n=1 Tax=Halalkalibacter nanhaiisediminis TaxID=688079 RepID=A0A562QK77_9BACI|nr:SigB/SigF/SigG family RNA polymerase sigma factor [Halalkalibacter nanhaiisediminis]TWI57167.1 RNA polymerase sigma-B factor [Halalkalibacter nanhaiisediminis]